MLHLQQGGGSEERSKYSDNLDSVWDSEPVEEAASRPLPAFKKV